MRPVPVLVARPGRRQRRGLVRAFAAAWTGVVAMLALAAPAEASAAGEVRALSVSVSPATAGSDDAAYSVGFTATHGVPAGGTVTLLAPGGTDWAPSGVPCDYSLIDQTTPSGSFACPTTTPVIKLADGGLPVYAFNDRSGAAVSITAPNPIKAGDHLALSVQGVVNPGAGSYSLEVSTSADPTPTISPSYTIGPEGSVGDPTVSLSSASAGASYVTYQVAFTATDAVPAGGSITVVGPPSTIFTTYYGCNYSLVDLTSGSGSESCTTGQTLKEVAADPGSGIYDFQDPGGAALTMALAKAINAGDRLEMYVSGVANPGPGQYRMSVATSSDRAFTASKPYRVGAPSAAVLSSLKVTAPAQAQTGGTYTLQATLPGGLPVGGTMAIWASPGTQLPNYASDFSVTDDTSPARTVPAPALALGDGKAMATLTFGSQATAGPTDAGIKAGDKVTITVAGVTGRAGTGGNLALSTSDDPVWARTAVGAAGSPTPGGQVKDATVHLSTDQAQANGVNETFSFTTGAALSGGTSTVAIVASAGAIFGSCPYGCGTSALGNNASYDLTDLTHPLTSTAMTVADLLGNFQGVELTVPDDVAAGDKLQVSVAQATNPVPGQGRFWVSTSGQPTPVLVSAPITAPVPPRSPGVSVSSTAAGAEDVTYTVSFTNPSLLLAQRGAITLAAPPGTIFGTCPYGCGNGNTLITVSDQAHPSADGNAGGPWVVDGGSTIGFLVPKDVPAGDVVKITVTQVTNPPPGPGTFAVSTSSASLPAYATVSFAAPATVASLSVSLAAPATPPGASPTTTTTGTLASGTPTVQKDMEVSLSLSPDGTLLGGLGAVTVIAPPGYDLSTTVGPTLTDKTDPSASGPLSLAEVVGDGSIASFLVSQTINGGDSVNLDFPGVTVPVTTSSARVNVLTSSDSALSGPPRSQLSSIARSLLTPSQAFSPVRDAIVNAGIAVGLVLFITFPSGLFNATFSENYEEIAGWWRRLGLAVFPARARRAARSIWRSASPVVPRGLSAEGHQGEHTRANVAFGAVLLLGALLGSLLDPSFGANLRALSSYVAIVLAMLAGVYVSGLVTHAYHRARRHGKVGYQLEALPLGLVVAGLCVLVSRLTSFEPGYLYGVICGVKFGRDLAKQEEGHVIALRTAATLALAIVGWLLWDALNPTASRPGAFFGSVVADDFLSSLFVSGLVGTVISLLPLRFLPGHKLQSWHKGAWAASFAVSVFLLVDAVLRPDSHVARSHVPLVSTLALFVVFGLGSLAFRHYFARKNKAGKVEGSPAGDGARDGAGAEPGDDLVAAERSSPSVPPGAED